MDREVRQDNRRWPDAAEHDGNPALRHLLLVVERVCDGNVPVDADAAEMQKGCGREEDVVGVEDVADRFAEHPPTDHFLWGVERHDEAGDEEIGKGQRYDEGVGDQTKLLEAENANNDQKVSEHSRTDYGEHDDRLQDSDYHNAVVPIGHGPSHKTCRTSARGYVPCFWDPVASGVRRMKQQTIGVRRVDVGPHFPSATQSDVTTIVSGVYRL